MRRVATGPTGGEYVLDGDAFTFSANDDGHELAIVYDAAGPRVTLIDKFYRTRIEVDLYATPDDPTGAIAAWFTVTPRTRNGGRVPKAPTLDESVEQR